MKMKLVTTTAAFFISLLSFSQITEGKISYTLEITSEDPERVDQILQGPKTAILYYTPKAVRTDMTMSEMEISLILDFNKRKGLSLMNIEGSKIAMPMEIPNDDEGYTGYDVEKTDETKEILGFTCHKYIVSYLASSPTYDFEESEFYSEDSLENEEYFELYLEDSLMTIEDSLMYSQDSIVVDTIDDSEETLDSDEDSMDEEEVQELVEIHIWATDAMLLPAGYKTVFLKYDLKGVVVLETSFEQNNTKIYLRANKVEPLTQGEKDTLFSLKNPKGYKEIDFAKSMGKSMQKSMKRSMKNGEF